jgi:hypothetical protein
MSFVFRKPSYDTRQSQGRDNCRTGTEARTNPPSYRKVVRERDGRDLPYGLCSSRASLLDQFLGTEAVSSECDGYSYQSVTLRAAWQSPFGVAGVPSSSYVITEPGPLAAPEADLSSRDQPPARRHWKRTKNGLTGKSWAARWATF